MADENDETQTEPVVDPSTTEGSGSSPKKEIMIPKSRFDQVNDELQILRQKPKEEKQKEDIDSIVDRKLAPLKIQIETDAVMRKYDDFEQFATPTLSEIKKNPALSLEDAYILSKAKSGTLQSKAKEEGKIEAYQTIEKKENLKFEQSGPKTQSRPIQDLISDKSVPLSEIAKQLPRS